MSSIVQVKDSAYDGLKSLTVYGKTVQNLWVNPDLVAHGVTIKANADGSFTLSGASTAVGPNLHSPKSYALKPGSSYYLGCSPLPPNFMVGVSQYIDGAFKRTASMPSGGGVITIDSGVTEVTCAIYGIDPNTTVSGTYRVMLREATPEEIAKAASTPQTLPVYPDGSGPDAGDEELGISPLNDGVSLLADSESFDWCPPGLNSVGDDGNVEVVTAGKNLAGGKWTNAAFDAVNGSIVSSNRYVMSETVPVISGKKITISCKSGYQICVGFWSKSGRYIGYAPWSNSPEVVTIPDDAVTMRTLLGHFPGSGSQTMPKDESIFKPMVEYGSTATDYEPPNITITPIDLQGHTLNALPDGTRDELHIDGGGNVVLEKRTQKVQLDGDGNWDRFDTVFVGYQAPWSYFNGLPTGESYENNYVDKLPASNSVPNGLYSASIGGTHAYLREPTFASDAAGVKTWMGANTPTVILPLLEPQTIDLGTIDLPKLRKKPLVNTIWANGTAEGTGFSLAPEIDCGYNRWSTYCDGFKTHGKHSYFDMGCCIAARDTGTPEKKSVTATVPYMSGFYDLSKLYGAIAFEARQLMYRFEFVEDSREELQQKKSQFLEWLSQVHDEEIADDDIPGRHFIGSLSEWEFEEGEEGQSGSLEVTFNCQPFLEADEDTTKTCNAGSNTVTVEGQAVNAYAKTSSGTATIQIGGVTQSVGTSEIRLSVQLQPGDNAVTVTGSPVVLRWKELTA